MITIDGSFGEGGGQIIRTSLALSLITGKPFRACNVRARRDKPGLQQQHLTGVRAAAAIGQAQVDGARLGAREFTFVPGAVTPGEYTFAIGTAGATTLVLQTVLPPLMLAAAPSHVTLEGGTHNIHAPPFEFLATTYLPLVNRTGPQVRLELERYGFYPPGGGMLRARIEPRRQAQRLDLLELGSVRRRRARALVARLKPSVGERALAVVRDELGWEAGEMLLETTTNARSPNVVLTLEIESAHLTEVITGIGERGVPVEKIAAATCAEAARYLEVGAPVGAHLADQLLLPLALGRGGSFVTGPLSLHTTTNIDIVRRFVPVEIATQRQGDGTCRIDVTV
jgi:RNA 3'-terminal phosphate cyclase (ATP)